MTGRHHRSADLDASMETDETQLTFSGNDGVDCEKFIHAIRRTAYIAGKVRDNDWIMDLVYSALTGEALRWHLSLPPEEGSNWRTLERLMVEKFPRKRPPSSSQSPPSAMDLGAIASGSSSASPGASSDISKGVNGHIRVYRSDGRINGFFATVDELAGVVRIHTDVEQALTFHCVYSSKPGVIELASWPGYGERWLGATQWANPLESPHFYTAVSMTNEDCTTSTASVHPKAVSTCIANTIWTVHPSDGEVTVLWPFGDRTTVLSASVDVNTGWIFLVEEFAPWAARCVQQGAAPLQVNLRFEPIANPT